MNTEKDNSKKQQETLKRIQERNNLKSNRNKYDYKDIQETRKVVVEKTTHSLGKFKITMTSVVDKDFSLVEKKEKSVCVMKVPKFENPKVEEPKAEEEVKEEPVQLAPVEPKALKKVTKKKFQRFDCSQAVLELLESK